MPTYKGIPFNGGMNAPTGTGAQHIVETCKAIIDFLVDCTTIGTLLDAPAGIVSIAWISRQASNDAGVAVLDWQAGQLNDIQPELSLNWFTRIAHDSGGDTSIDWGNRTLQNTALSTALDWENQLLNTSSGALALAWNQRQAIHSSGAATVDWEACALNTPGNSPIITFNTGLGFFGAAESPAIVSGPQTAGAIYTATERGMLQTVYDALRTYGLLVDP